MESVKGKFEKLVATKKPKGDPPIPPSIPRAKHISRDILNRASARYVVSSDGNFDEIEKDNHRDGEDGHRNEIASFKSVI